MAFIAQVGTALPRHALDQSAVAATVAGVLRLGEERAAALRALFAHTHVRERRSVLPLELVGERRSLTDSMSLYRRHALELALAAAKSCLEQAALAPAEIDFVVTSSCTGVLLPSLTALLVKPLGLRRDVHRLPITELGCAGGASALARAHAHLRAFPLARVLVIAVELPSLTFQTEDASPANLVASALFGDGAAAVLLTSDPAPAAVEILATHTEILPGSIDDMGFDLRESGLHVVLSKDVPRLIAEHAPLVVRRFLRRHDLAPEDLAFVVLHPGGRRVLEALEDGLALERGRTVAAWEVLRDYGNQSSAAVLFVLAETLRRGVPGGPGLLAAFGPGITVELALLRSQPC
ncbi:MAG TPA: 3-oxoacyl-[acyl-carrier-protein] synthase III C-terminal domain-containing protein [Polyangiaceae bacterium]